MANMELGAADWVNASLAEAMLAQQGPPLFVGAKWGCVAAVRVMTEIGAHLEVTGENGWHPTHAAAAHGHVTVLGVLVSAGADIEARDALGNTPLMTAIEAHQQGAVELLLAVGANMKARRDDGMSVINLSRQYGVPPDIVELLALGMPSSEYAQPDFDLTDLPHPAENSMRAATTQESSAENATPPPTSGNTRRGAARTPKLRVLKKSGPAP